MTEVQKKAIFVWNDSAGSAGSGEPLRQACDAHFAAIHATAAEARQVVQAAAEDVALVVAAGGDGTINSVINALRQAGSSAALGVLPLGTGNDFCRSLGIPLDPYEALRLLVSGESRAMDLGSIDVGRGGQLFGNVAAGGNADQMKQLVTDEMKAKWGALCYVRGAISALATLQGYRTQLSIDDRPVEELSLWNIVVANGEFSGGGMAVAPGASIDDGWLDVVAVLDGTPIEIATLAANFVLGNFLEHDSVRHWRAKRVSIASNPPMTFSLDGETLAAAKYDFEVLPRALQVIAPRLDQHLSSAAAIS